MNKGGKMEVKIQKTNPSPNKTNPQPPQNQNNVNNPQTNPAILGLQGLRKQIEYLQQQLEQLQKQNNLSPQNNTTGEGEFIVKANMKASVLALKTEQMLMLKRKIVYSALGFAIPIAVDAMFLVKKDMSKMGKQVNINVEFFEKEVQLNRKTISGIKIALSI